MSYTNFRDGYKRETTERTSIITAAGDTTYLLGAVSQKSIHPSPVAMVNYPATGVNTKEVGAGLAWKGNMVLRGMYGLRMQNGILCEMAMGASSTAGADPYTHTITPTTDGSVLPSFTINHEQKGTATDEEYQFVGCKVDSLMLSHDLKEANFLMAKVEWMAMKAQDGIDLTTGPALPATAVTTSYPAPTRTFDTGGTPLAIDGLSHIEISIINGLMPVYSHTYDAGTYTGMWPQEFIEAQRKQYLITMQATLNTIERAVWDKLIATDTAIVSTFKWTRSTNDYIQVTATGPVVEHQLVTPQTGEHSESQIVIEPYAMSIEVKDSIVGGFYGE
jgi:hypothetical protein